MDSNDDALTIPVPLRFPGIDSRVRAFRCLGFVDSWAVVSDRYVVLTDTLTSPAAMQTVLDSVGVDRPIIVINTHGDWDHVWGNALFDGPSAKYQSPIVGHASTAARFDPVRSASFLADSQSRHPDWYEGVEFRLPTIEVSGPATLRGGDLTLELILTPGHTPDHLSVWIPEIKLLIAGDAAEMPLPYVGEESSIPEMRASLARMAELNPEYVLYSHGGEFCTPEIIHHNLRYLDECETRCRAWHDADARDTPTSESLGWPLEDVMPHGVAVDELFSVEFYRSSHDKAIAAMWSWINQLAT